MAHEQNLCEPLSHVESDENVLPNRKKKPVSTASGNANGCFDCNICLDSAQEPVVTLCGHLYCWPCIYKWLHVQIYSDEGDNEPKCPVCKAKISQSSLVPLYGRGTSPSESDPKRPQFGMTIPRRPPALGVSTLVTSAAPVAPHPNEQIHTNPFQTQQLLPNPYGSYGSTMGSSNFGSTAMSSSMISPTVGMFGELVFAGMFGNSEPGLFPCPYSSNYPVPGNGGPRIRRQEMQLDKSLNRVSVFLFCCLLLCLLLF